ncbi:DEAD/DEAH box helicase domain-containing protein [Metschnikowia aff. pulcherrima]|uniref:DEAD/DEAH box helicase domain-containing protein n=1 Tax=Metschnikowia aff. pulcherrima TaxID=2163413 RepID=A0A4P6XII3_9ASCO|nr:DEAD/DEAH box helicase domain-containing protein [Metschnikowia aff. pulcherrima]
MCEHKPSSSSISLGKDDSNKPWPLFFQELFRKFNQINTHLTFLLSFSRHTIPTAEHLRKLNADISDLDLQMIRDLLPPGDVTFGYFDENQVLLQHLEKVQYSAQKGYAQNQPKTVDDAYEALAKDTEPGHERQLLVFEFCDVRTQGIGAAIKGNKFQKKRQKREPSPGPEFFSSSSNMSLGSLSQEQLLAIIKGRNERFQTCIESYLEAFSEDETAEGVPFKSLVETCTQNVPEPANMADPVTIMEAATGAHKNANLTDKPSVEEMLAALKDKPLYRDQIRKVFTLTEARDARLHKIDPELLHPALVDALWPYKGVDAVEGGLYLHQEQAISAIINERKHVIVSTSTSSGKSFIYQLPILNEILRDCDSGANAKRRTTTAMLIFPTKALAQDQMRHLKELISHFPPNQRKIVVDTYDGDTPAKSRGFIRNFADIIFTNPDAIHAAILPNQSSEEYGQDKGWLEFLSNLKYVIMDELHVYRGTFGIHVSYVMARLNRLRSTISLTDLVPLYISCLATIDNPEAHFRTLCAIPGNDEILHVFEDGSPSTEKKMVIWEPPILMNKKGQREKPQAELQSATSLKTPIQSAFLPRENIVGELAKILVHLLCMLPSIKMIVFCPVRAVCELLIKEIKTLISDKKNPEWLSLSEHDVMAYRGGYAKADRRAIEHKMFLGHLRAIVATNALELGIDLSDLDVVISCGFPILKLNLHQQFGRAGRGKSSKGSLAILVCGSSPVDRYYLKNSHELCDKTYEDLCVDGFLDGSLNKLVMSMHLQCAAFEWPLDLEIDSKWFCIRKDPEAENKFKALCQEKLHQDKKGRYRTDPRYLPWPAEKVSLRAIEQTMYAVVDITDNRNVVIEEVEELRTSFTLYEGGIFLHQGYPYLVKDFNTEDRYAKVERVKVTWTTQQRDFSDVDPLEIELVKQLNITKATSPTDIPVFYGKVQTTIIVFGYFKVNRKSEILEAVEVNNPPVVLRSKGFWIDIPSRAIEIIKEKSLNPAGGIHAAQHAVMNVLPLHITGGATTNPNARFTPGGPDSELSTECKAPEKEFAKRQSARKRPARLIFYDSKGGEQGTGMSGKTFEYIDEIVCATYERVRDCECTWGCPLCVAGTFCKENMLVMSKPGAIIILGTLLGVDAEELKDSVPDGPEPNMPLIGTETIAEGDQIVKFSPDVQIVSVRKAKRKLVEIKQENEAA